LARHSREFWRRFDARVATETAPYPHTVAEDRQNRLYSRFFFRAPSIAWAVSLLIVASLVDAALVWLPEASIGRFAEGWSLVFLLPGLLGVLLTTPLATALGGRFPWHRNTLLGLMCATVPIPLLMVWRGLGLALGHLPTEIPLILLFLQGPILWFRHMTLFGVSKPQHGASLPASLFQPVIAIIGVFLIYPPPAEWVLAAGLFLLFGFLCGALLLRAADRPIRREFGSSGVSFIRPLIEHVGSRDPGATQILERFFEGFAVEANVRITEVQFRTPHGAKATLTLPTMHPGPFAALGASNLPQKLEEQLGPDAGLVFVPHTPCNHDLDVPTTSEVRRVGEAAVALLHDLPAPSSDLTSPLVAGASGSWARAQRLGDVVLVAATQAPEPTDDIAYAIADRLVDENRRAGHPELALIDAHNSYKEDEGDLTYGSPRAKRFAEDVQQAVAAAVARAAPGEVRVGVALRTGFSVGREGIGPSGVRALVVDTAGRRTAYVLLDGNNLIQGLRERLIQALGGVVDDSEVMTTDNHVVHEVDGGVNPIGERIPFDLLRETVVGVVRDAVANLEPVEVRVGTREVANVAVLGPDWTARLLTSLGDTLSMFSNAFLMTFLLLMASSMVVLAILR
jgi:putative membrane protein